MKTLEHIDEWEWSDIRKYVSQVGSRYDIVVRNEPDRAGFTLEHIHVSFRPDGRGSGTFGRINYINCNSAVVVLECERQLTILDRRLERLFACLESIGS
jgi:hypothetical protein